jgi:hypothetical protein
MRRTAHSIARIGMARMHDEHLQAANDARCRAMERRTVILFMVLLALLAARLLLRGQFA